jgi:hypothetical protein
VGKKKTRKVYPVGLIKFILWDIFLLVGNIETEDTKMTAAIERAAKKAAANKCRVKLLGGRTYLVVTPQNHKYVVRFETVEGKRYGRCTCKAGSVNQACYHLIGAAITDTAAQHMRAR